MLELGLAGVPVVSMLTCGDRSKIQVTMEDVSEEDIQTDLDNLCLRWYQLAAYMPALHSEYGNEKYNTIMTKNVHYKWIKRSLSHRILVRFVKWLI